MSKTKEDIEYQKLIRELEENLRLNKSEENLNYENEDIGNIDFEIVPGYRTSSNLLWVQSENCFFKQNVYSKTHNGIAYTCYDEDCKARKVLADNGTKLITINSTHVPHLPMNKMYKELYYLNLMKELCKSEPHSVTVSQIYERTQLKWEADPECQGFGVFPIVFISVEKTLNNHRSAKLCKAPSKCDEIDEVFKDPLLRETFCKSHHKEKYNLYDKTYSSKEFGYCIYSSKKSIELLCRNVPESERFLLMDATFSITPNRIFYQVLIIYARYFEKSYPLVYIMMTRKTQKAYEHALRYIHENILTLHCEAIITDYEQAMRQAIKTVVPGIKQLGCWFHYAQCIRRKVASHAELFEQIRTNEIARNMYYKMICLALLPHGKIEKAFNELALEALQVSKTFTPFIKYFQDQWLKRVGPMNFSVFLEETRTTCAAEGYNGKLGKKFQTHPNFFVFIEYLQVEELAKSNAFEQHIHGSRQVQPKKMYRERSAQIRNESLKFNIPNQTNAKLFLNRIANTKNKILPKEFETFVDIVNYNNENEELLDDMCNPTHADKTTHSIANKISKKQSPLRKTVRSRKQQPEKPIESSHSACIHNPSSETSSKRKLNRKATVAPKNVTNETADQEKETTSRMITRSRSKKIISNGCS